MFFPSLKHLVLPPPVLWTIPWIIAPYFWSTFKAIGEKRRVGLSNASPIVQSSSSIKSSKSYLPVYLPRVGWEISGYFSTYSGFIKQLRARVWPLLIIPLFTPFSYLISPPLLTPMILSSGLILSPDTTLLRATRPNIVTQTSNVLRRSGKSAVSPPAKSTGVFSPSKTFRHCAKPSDSALSILTRSMRRVLNAT